MNDDCIVDLTPDNIANGQLIIETEWLISQACNLLNDTSYPIWKQALIDTNNYETICGFTVEVHRGSYNEGFWSGFSTRLTNNECVADCLFCWEWTGTTDPAVISWMENACDFCNRTLRGDSDYIDPVKYAAAVNPNGRWVLEERTGIFGYKYYRIVLQQ